jgi:hypothetical protein
VCQAPEDHEGEGFFGHAIPWRDIEAVYDTVRTQVDEKYALLQRKGLAIAVVIGLTTLMPVVGLAPVFVGWFAQGLALRCWLRKPMRSHFSGKTRWYLVRWIPRLMFLKVGLVYKAVAVMGGVGIFVIPVAYFALNSASYGYLCYSFQRERDEEPVALWENLVVLVLVGILVGLTLLVIGVAALVGGIAALLSSLSA